MSVSMKKGVLYQLKWTKKKICWYWKLTKRWKIDLDNKIAGDPLLSLVHILIDIKQKEDRLIGLKFLWLQAYTERYM